MIKLTEQEVLKALHPLRYDDLSEREISVATAAANAIQDALIAKNGGAEPFGFLKQTDSSRNPPHGWAFHFTQGEVPVFLTPQTAEVQGWQPIETAPKDGSRVLLRATVGSMLVPEPKTVVGRYSRGWWLDGASMDLSYVTHWMPLPTPPAMAQGEKK